jgi:hypothetical protein
MLLLHTELSRHHASTSYLPPVFQCPCMGVWATSSPPLQPSPVCGSHHNLLLCHWHLLSAAAILTNCLRLPMTLLPLASQHYCLRLSITAAVIVAFLLLPPLVATIISYLGQLSLKSLTCHYRRCHRHHCFSVCNSHCLLFTVAIVSHLPYLLAKLLLVVLDQPLQ